MCIIKHTPDKSVIRSSKNKITCNIYLLSVSLCVNKKIQEKSSLKQSLNESFKKGCSTEFTSAGTYWSTAVATVAQQIQIRTNTDRIRVVVRIHPGSHGFLRSKARLLNLCGSISTFNITLY